MFRLVHLSDLHLWHHRVQPAERSAKRLVGIGNLWAARTARLPRRVVVDAIERAASLRPDHAVVSGDLTQTSLEAEFERAREVLEPLAGSLTVVPGNHDRYTAASVRSGAFERCFGAFGPGEGFPFVMDFEHGVRIIGIDSARPTGLHSRGHVPRGQLAALFELLERSRREKKRTFLVCHYPYDAPNLMRHEPLHRLSNARALREVLVAARQPVVFLHGHIHRPWAWVPRATPHVLCVNAASTAQADRSAPHGHGFWEILVEHHDVKVIRHRPDREGQWHSWVELDGFHLRAAA
jgi:3',5'-cyclic AMP phosphodiesterase CpdA